MYKIKIGVKVYSFKGWLVVRRALPLFVICPFIILATLSSCATRRDLLTHTVVTDTTHVTVTDTTHIISEHDSTVLAEREVIHERIVTLFDRDTGQPIEQSIDRDISRQRDSLVLHLRDSIRHALQIEALHARADSLHHEEHRATGSSALSPVQYTARLVVVCVLLIGMVIFMVCAMRTA